MRIIAFLLLLISANAEAVTLYISPTGSAAAGTCITPSAARCSWTTAKNAAMPGDTVSFGIGTYAVNLGNTVRSGTSGNPITFKSEIPWAAVIAPPPSLSTGVYYFNINAHSYITVEGLTFNGNNACCGGGGLRAQGTSTASPIVGYIVQNNRFLNAAATHMFLSATSGTIIRWNYFHTSGSGAGLNGEAIYLGSNSGSSGNVNAEIYANVMIDPMSEAIDIKPASHNNAIHHIIADGVARLTADGMDNGPTSVVGPIMFASGSTGNTVTDSIFRRYKGRDFGGCATKGSGSATATFGTTGNGNVCRDSLDGTTNSVKGIGSTAVSVSNFNVTDTIFCTPHTAGAFSVTPTGVTLTNNQGIPNGVAVSNCNNREAAIKAEFSALAGNPQNTMTKPTVVA